MKLRSHLEEVVAGQLEEAGVVWEHETIAIRYVKEPKESHEERMKRIGREMEVTG